MIFGFPYTTMMPLFARDLLQLGPKGFGMLLSVSSIGALVGTTWLSLGKAIKGEGKWLIYSIMGFGFALLLFIGTTNVFIAATAMFFDGVNKSDLPDGKPFCAYLYDLLKLRHYVNGLMTTLPRTCRLFYAIF